MGSGARDAEPSEYRSKVSAARRAPLDRSEPADGAGTEVQRDDVLGPEDVAKFSAEDRALGRHAAKPTEIPARGWLAVIKRVAREAISDEAGTAAASCGFYALLALFPTLSVAMSLFGLVADPASVEGQLEAIRDVLPPSTFELISLRVHDLAAAGPTKLSSSLLVSLLVATWSAMSGVKAIINALNVAYEERETRSFLRLNGVAFLFMVIGTISTLLALAVIVAVPAALAFSWLGPLASAAVRILSFVLLVAFVVLGLSMLYRFAPSRSQAKWRWITPGSLLAAGLWLIASLAFSFYVSNFGSYDAAYGALGGVVVALLWFYISAYAVILGAELNAELELQTRRDTTTGPVRPMGRRDAFVADHVATGS